MKRPYRHSLTTKQELASQQATGASLGMDSSIIPLSRVEQGLHASRAPWLTNATDKTASTYTGSQRWMIPYADFLTVLLGVCLVLFSLNQTQTLKHAKDNQTRETTQESAQLAQQLTQAGTAGRAPVEPKDWETTLAKELGLEKQQITMRQEGRGLVLSFQERLFFAPGEAELSPQALTTLTKLAKLLAPLHCTIQVEGHTDNTPIHTAAYPSNWELSVARAAQIVQALIQYHQIRPERLSAAGYGEFHPLADNSTIQGKQKNRRVDIVLLNPRRETPSSGSNGGDAPNHSAHKLNSVASPADTDLTQLRQDSLPKPAESH